jgi:Mandelate racemase / muconate lactonizing enzyme, N-terminal domain
MKITALHTAVVEGNYDWTFVRIDTDADGLSELGECYTAPGLTAIVRDLAPLLVGEDPRDVDRLWSKLRWGASGAGSPAGIVYNAISGMEAALWDLVGRAYTPGRRSSPPAKSSASTCRPEPGGSSTLGIPRRFASATVVPSVCAWTSTCPSPPRPSRPTRAAASHGAVPTPPAAPTARRRDERGSARAPRAAARAGSRTGSMRSAAAWRSTVLERAERASSPRCRRSLSRRPCSGCSPCHASLGDTRSGGRYGSRGGRMSDWKSIGSRSTQSAP